MPRLTKAQVEARRNKSVSIPIEKKMANLANDSQTNTEPSLNKQKLTIEDLKARQNNRQQVDNIKMSVEEPSPAVEEAAPAVEEATLEPVKEESTPSSVNLKVVTLTLNNQVLTIHCDASTSIETEETEISGCAKLSNSSGFVISTSCLH